MATASSTDHLIDAATEAHAEALGIVYRAQHTLHNAVTALNFAWEDLARLSEALANRDATEPGPLFLALEELRADPTLRRKVNKAVAS